MSQLQIAEDFIKRAGASETTSDLFHLLQAVTEEIGFKHFALIHHTDLSLAAPHIVRIENYPGEWAEYFIKNNLYADDPIHRACLVSAVGFSWSEVSSKISMARRQWSILESAARYGLRKGYTVPVNIPGESSGSCSFATEGNADLPPGGVLLAELIGGFAFEAARRLAPQDEIPPLASSHLTPRQHDCLLLVIHGKTDKEIGRILGISGETVSEYIDLLRRRYKVAKRLTLAIRAIYDGQISFIEAFAEEPPLRGG